MTAAGDHAVYQQHENHHYLFAKPLLEGVADPTHSYPHYLFDPQWLADNSQEGFNEQSVQTTGRGAVNLIELNGEQQPLKLVLRRYRRGGLPGKLTKNSYVWTGLDRTRAWREFRLLQQLQQMGLPVPFVMAAHVQRQGLRYSAELITEFLSGTETLLARLQRHPLTADQWQAVGRCIRLFHDHNVYHADLNAGNILLGNSGIHLLDFDRGNIVGPGDADTATGQRWKAGNLRRLHRSLSKVRVNNLEFAFAIADWQNLQAGYGNR